MTAPTEGQTTTPSGADVLAMLDEVSEPIAKHLSDATWQKHADARTAVAALIARNAELEAERGALHNAMAAISALDPRDTNDGFNEWGEAQCFNTAQRIANDALAPIECRAPTELDALIAERDALREDAERYRWLRYRTGGRKVQWGTEFQFPAYHSLPARLPDWPAGCNVGDYLDAAIDAARTAAGKG